MYLACILRRWRLAVCTLPLVLIMVGFRLLVWFGGNSSTGGWIPPDVFQTFITLAIFVSAVLLQGVVQDYRESEKLVSDVHSYFDDLLESIEIAQIEYQEHKKLSSDPIYPREIGSNAAFYVENILFALIAVVDGTDKLHLSKILNIMCISETNLFRIFNQRPKVKTKRLAKPIENIRKAIARIYVIKKTNYIKGCHSLMISMIIIGLTLMATTKWPRETASGTAIAFTVIITFLFSYLGILIWVLEDPFRYPNNHILKCFLKSDREEMSSYHKVIYEASIDIGSLAVDFRNKLIAKIEMEDYTQVRRTKEDFLKEAEKMEVYDDPKSGFNVTEWDEARPEPLLHWCIFALSSLPFVLLMVGLRLAVWYGAGVGGWLNPSVFVSFISLTVFLTALLLQGIIQDYRDAERMPSELLGSLLGLEAAVYVADSMAKEAKKGKASKPEELEERPQAPESDRPQPASDSSGGTVETAVDQNMRGLRKHVLSMLIAVIWIADTEMEGDTPVDKPFYLASESIREAEKSLLEAFIQASAFDAIPSLLKPLDTVRQAAARMQVIQKTRYLPAGYTIVDSMVLIVLALMAVTDWPLADHWYSAIGYTTSITFLFVYLCLLIRAVEDPFRYLDKRNFKCLCDQKEQPFKLNEAFKCESIDLRILTLGIGGRFIDLMTPIAKGKDAKGDSEKSKAGTGRLIASASLASHLLKNGGKKSIDQLSSWRSPAKIPGFTEELPISHVRNPRYLIRRWRLAAWSLPYVALLVGCRLAVWYGGGVGGWVDPTVFSSFIGLVIFVASVLVQGVVQNYKDSERITSEIFSAFQGLLAAVQVAHDVAENSKREKKLVDEEMKVQKRETNQPLVQSEGSAPTLHISLMEVERALLAVISILDGSKQLGTALIEIEKAGTKLHANFRDLQAHPGGIIAAIDSIVAIACRLHVTQHTKFLSAGYALLDGMVLLIFVLMCISNWPTDSIASIREGAAYTVVISYVFSYIRILLGDLENPFNYPQKYCEKCYRNGCRPEDSRPVGKNIPSRSKKRGAATQAVNGDLSSDSEKENLSQVRTQWTWQELANEFNYGGSVTGTTMLTVVFGAQLKTLIEEDKNSSPVPGDAQNDANQPTSYAKSAADSEAAQENIESASVCQVWLKGRKRLRKYRLVIRSIPFVLALVGFRLAVWYCTGVGGWIDSPKLFNVFTRLVIFVSTIVLQGLIQDYKGAEKIPAELAASIFGITTTMRLWGRLVTHLDKKINRRQEAGFSQLQLSLLDTQIGNQMSDLFNTVLDFLEKMSSASQSAERDSSCLAAMRLISVLNEKYFGAFLFAEKQLEKAKTKGYKLSSPEKHFKAIRSALFRVYLIQNTSNILETYALMDLMVLWIFGVLTATVWPFNLSPSGVPAGAAYTVVIPFLFTYLGWFVRNLENPFDYPNFFLHECYVRGKRMQKKLKEEDKYGGSVDMAPLTIGYGKFLKTITVPASTTGKTLAKELEVLEPSRSSTESTRAVYRTPLPLMSINISLQKKIWDSTIYLFRRFRLVLQTLPFVAVMVGLRLVVWFCAGVGGWIDPSVPLSFVSIAIFVTSFLLQVVMQDYREADRIPCAVSVALQGITAITRASTAAENVSNWNKDYSERTQRSMQEKVQQIAVRDVFCATVAGLGVGDERKQTIKARRKIFGERLDNIAIGTIEKGIAREVGFKEDEFYNKQYGDLIKKVDEALLDIFRIFGKVSSKDNDDQKKPTLEFKFTDTAWECAGPVADIRSALMRMRHIKGDSFISDGYSLMDSILLAVFVLITLTDWPADTYYGTAMATTIVISGLFTYMALLIRSVENPFKYPPYHHDGVTTREAPTRKQAYDFSICSALDCGTPVDPSILTVIVAEQIRNSERTGPDLVTPALIPSADRSIGSELLAKSQPESTITICGELVTPVVQHDGAALNLEAPYANSAVEAAGGGCAPLNPSLAESSSHRLDVWGSLSFMLCSPVRAEHQAGGQEILKGV